MPNTQKQRISANIFQRRAKPMEKAKDHAGVGQDKNAAGRKRPATFQPVTPAMSSRTPPPNADTPAASAESTTRNKRVYIMLWVNPVVKEELERRARRNGLSLSATGGALLERALQQDLDMEYGALLEPVIRKEITRHMRNYTQLFFRIAFSSEQTRALVTNILSRQPVDIDEDMLAEHPDILDALLDSTAHVARGKIMQKSPQLQRIIAEFEQDGEKKEPA
jgi:hypothetical protein